MDTTNREYDVIVWGATGFTGRLVAEYYSTLTESPPLRWAMGGRNRAKLEEVRASLGPRGAEVPLLLANADDPASLRALAGRTSVVLTTVGPFSLHGGPVVAACVDAGTHYCDITGEVAWMRQMISAHHEAAKERGLRIVHTCGYDSIPSDLGVMYLQRFAVERIGSPCVTVRFYAGETKGGMSGGTAASGVNMLREARSNPELRRVMADPYSLDPEPRPTGPDGPDATSVRFDDVLGQWIAPFIMARTNTRVVRRTHALLGRPWGADFRYSEEMSCGDGPLGLARAAAVTAGLGAFAQLGRSPALLDLVAKRVLPASGEGPSRDLIEHGYFVVRLIGDHPSGKRVKVTLRGERDPGYGGTARMLGQSAICLARDPLDTPGGVITPVTAMGQKLLERLQTQGFKFDAAVI